MIIALLMFALVPKALAVRDISVDIHEMKRHQGHLSIKQQRREEIYWEARDKAKLLRQSLPATAFTTNESNLGMFLRVWDFYTPDYNCPVLKERVGRVGDGGKWVCGLRYPLQDHPCLVYSLGSRGDASFEAQILKSL